jgi:hypothetical protein
MPTFLYAIGRPQGPIKIGISDNPAGRLAQFQTSCPFKITVLHVEACDSRHLAMVDEAFAHRQLKDRRLWGEWFNITYPEAYDAIVGTVFSGRAFREREAAGEFA